MMITYFVTQVYNLLYVNQILQLSSVKVSRQDIQGQKSHVVFQFAIVTDNQLSFPGSSIKYILVTEAVAQRKIAPIYFARGQQSQFRSSIETEEEEWDAKTKTANESSGNSREGSVGSFEEYREKGKAAGMM